MGMKLNWLSTTLPMWLVRVRISSFPLYILALIFRNFLFFKNIAELVLMAARMLAEHKVRVRISYSALIIFER